MWSLSAMAGLRRRGADENSVVLLDEAAPATFQPRDRGFEGTKDLLRSVYTTDTIARAMPTMSELRRARLMAARVSLAAFVVVAGAAALLLVRGPATAPPVPIAQPLSVPKPIAPSPRRR